MEKGQFKKVARTDERMHGPRKILVCGYGPKDQESVLSLLAANQLHDLPVIFVRTVDLDCLLADLLEQDHASGLGEPSQMRRAIIMSGFIQKELHTLMSAYRGSGLPNQLWAALTPISENWPVTDLLEELAKEAEAMEKMD